MKWISVLFVGLLLCAPLAWAGDFDDFFDEGVRGNSFGVQVDAPNLVKVAGVAVGAEVTKDLRQERWEGYTLLAKVTLPWTVLDFTKKGE